MTLVGTWKNSDTQQMTIGPDEWRITEEKAQLRIESFIAKSGTYEVNPAKTFKDGNYDFIFIKDRSGFEGHLFRYKSENGVLKIYDLKKEPAISWLKENHPQAKNIGVGDYGRYDPGVVKMHFVRIKAFDDEAFKILSAIPDTDACWTINSQYQRQ
jgi:hypothetical protein